MATSLTSPALAFAADKAIIAARKAIAKATLFSTDFSAEAAQPGTTLKVPVYNGGTAETFNASSANYEHPTGTVTFASVTFDSHIKSTFQFDDKDFTLISGLQFWANAGKASGQSVAAGIIKTLSSKITYSTCTTKTVCATITKANIAKLRKACADNAIDPSKSVIMLQPSQFADLLALLDMNVYGGTEAVRSGIIENLYGFKAVIENSDLPTNDSSSTQNCCGAIVPEDAIALAGRVIPVGSPANYQEVGTTQDESSGLVLGVRRHGDPSTGANYATVEALFGAALVQPTKIIRIVTQ